MKQFFLIHFKDFQHIQDAMIGKDTFRSLLLMTFLISICVEMSRVAIGKGDINNKVGTLLLGLLSLMAFNSFNEQVLDASFSLSGKIISVAKISNVDKFFNLSNQDKLKSIAIKDSDLINKEEIDSAKKEKKFKYREIFKSTNGNPLVGQAVMNVSKKYFSQVAVGILWSTAGILLVITRSIYSLIYYLVILIGPIIVTLSILTGFESSLKSFWQTFVFLFIAPIAFSIVFVLLFTVIFQLNNDEASMIDLLLNMIVSSIMLLGSFVLSYAICTGSTIAAFAEKASMMGAVALAGGAMAGATATTKAATLGIPTANGTKLGGIIPTIKKGINFGNEKFNLPGGTVKDISKDHFFKDKESNYTSAKNPKNLREIRQDGYNQKFEQNLKNNPKLPELVKPKSEFLGSRKSGESIANDSGVRSEKVNLSQQPTKVGRAIRSSMSDFNVDRPQSGRAIDDSGLRIKQHNISQSHRAPRNIKRSFSKEEFTKNKIKPKSGSSKAQNTTNENVSKNINRNMSNLKNNNFNEMRQ